MLKPGKKIKTLCKQKKLKYDTTKKKIFRIKKDLKAMYFQENGMTASRNILTSKLQENIQNFLKVFQESLKSNSLHRMRKYFGRSINDDEIPKFNISEVIEYDISTPRKNTYRIELHYFDEDVFKSFTFTIEANQNQIKIVELPKYCNKITVYDTEDLSDFIMDQLQEDKRTGTLRLTGKQIMELLPQSRIIEEYYLDESE